MMKLAKLLLMLLLFGYGEQVIGQCPNDNTFLMNATPPASPGISTTTVNCINGGQYVTVGVIAGNVYTFSTCGNTAFDTQITVLNALTSALIGYNDDACGLQSTVTWTATFTGNVNVLIDQYSCSNTGLCTTLVITSSPPIQNGSGCNTNTTICTQGVNGPFGFSTPGPPVSSCLDFFGPNYAYIVLYITQSGPLQLLINGSAVTGFLDVAIFNVPTGVDPCVASLNTANEISCNYASTSSGCNQIGTAFPCASSVPSPNVVAGQVLFIVVENWSGTSNNFTLSLGPAPAAQTGPPNGTVNPAGPFCSTGAPVQLTSVVSGGTWSGPGVSATGMFNPATAGLGTHTINYSVGAVPCVGTGSTTITVGPPPTINAVANQTRCANTATTAINFTGSAGATFNWTNNNTATGLGASGSGNIPSFTATNNTGSPITSTITVTPVIGGCTGTPITFTITVNPVPTVNAVANQTRCANTATTAISFSGSSGSATYNWTNSNTAIGLGASGSGTIPVFTATNSTGSPITGTITVTPTANGCVGTPVTFTITVNPIPTVNAVANQTRCANTATTAITFGGNVGTATYNWTNNNTTIGLGASGSGTIPSFTATNATGSPITATITVTPTANGCTGTPTTFTITVNPVPTVNAVPNQTLCANATTAAVNFTGSMGTSTYNWTNSNTAIGLGASGSGNIPAFTATNATGTAISGTITVTPTANGCIGTPITFTITVSPAGNASFTMTNYCQGAASPPATVTGTGGGTFSFNPSPGGGVTINPTTGVISGGVGGATYTVQYTTGGACPQTSTQTVTVYSLPVLNAPNVSICIGGTATITATGASTYSWSNGLGAGQTQNVSPVVNTNYTVTGTSVNGCTSVALMTVSVLASAPINAGPDVSICSGGSTVLTATGGATYAWAAPISASGASQTVSPVGTTTYTVNGTDATGCTGTDQIVVTVNPVPSVNAITSQTLCANLATTAINFSGPVAGTTFAWTNNTTSIGLGASGSGNIPSFTATNATGSAVTATITVTPTANGCVGTPITFTITVNPRPTVNTVANQTRCANTATTAINFTGSMGTATYNWTNSNTAIGLGASGSGNIPVFTATNATGGPITATITVTPTASGCAGTPITFTITVNPTPTVNAITNQTRCANTSTTAITFSGNVGTATYNWTNSNTAIGLGASGSGNIPSFTATNATGSPISGTITVTPTANGCTGTPVTFTITVNPIPTVNSITNQTVCAGTGTTAVNFSGNTPSAIYNWTNSNTAIGLGGSGSGNIASFTATNATGSPITSTITVTPAANGCLGTPTSFTITVNPLPTATITGTASVCVGAPSQTVTFTGSNGSAPYAFAYNLNGGATQTIISNASGVATISVPTSATGTFNYNLLGVASSVPCFQIQSGTATITVNPNPSPVINGSATYCAGSTATLSTSIPYSTYLWSTGATTANINVTAANNPITVTVTNAQGCSAISAAFTVTQNSVITNNTTVQICQGQTAVIHGNVQSVAGIYSQTYMLPTGCDSVSNVTLVVNALPTVNPGANQVACFGTTTTLNATGAPTISWNNGVTNGVPFNQAVGTVTYTASGTSAAGCVNTANVNVTMNPLPTATISGTASVCVGAAGQTVTLTGANGTAPYTFTYTINGASSQTVVSNGAGIATITAPTGVAGTFNYNLVSIQSSSTGCSQTQSGTATIIVNPVPTATIAGTATVCIGGASPTITLTGSNATAPYTFTYTINGGANQTIVSNGSGVSTISVPTGVAGSFSYNLVSVSSSGSSACSQTQIGTATITVNPLPTATISGSTAVCVGAVSPVVTLSGSSGTLPYTFTYNLNGGANQTIVSNAAGVATINASTGTAGTFNFNLVSVAGASINACSQVQSGTATITVNPLPTATISGTTTVCQGSPNQTITFTGANGTAPYTFTYTLNGGMNQTIVSNGVGVATLSAPATSAGTFNYTLVSVQGSSSTACLQNQTGTATLTVNPLPTAIIAGTATVCQNDPTPVVTFTGANGTAPYTFTYTVNGGANQTVVSNATGTVTVNAPTGVSGTFDYELLSVQDASTSSCSNAQVGLVTITVNPNPTATISGTVNVCLGDANPTITLTGANGLAPYTFTYNVNNTGNITVTSVGDIATISVPTIVAGVFNFNLVSVDDANAGCSQTQSGTATVTVNDLPNVFAGNDLTICEGEQAVLTGSGAVGYVWDQGVVNGVLFAPSMTNTYTVTGTDINGCVNTDDVTITVEAAPVVSFIGDNLAGCAPLTVTFTNTTPGSLDNCVWTLENGTVLNGCGSVTTAFNSPGTYDVTLTTTSTTGCTASVTYTDYIYVEADPIASFSPSSTLISNLNPEVYFENTSTGAVTYDWNFGTGTPTVHVVSPIYQFPDDEPGTYNVELIAYSALGCADTAFATIQLTEEVIFYVPNSFTPDDDDYNPTFQPVFSSGYDPYDFTLLIFNRWGEIIFESHNADIGWDGTYGGIRMQDGTYTWKIEFKTTTSDERKVVVGHVNLLE